MSASNKKKLRKEQKAAALSEKQRKEQKEARNLKIWTSVFAVAMVCVLLLFIGARAFDSTSGTVLGMLHRGVTAYTINDNKLSNADLNYFYIDAINDEITRKREEFKDSGLKTLGPDETPESVANQQ